MICGECHSPAIDPVKPGPAWPWCCRACFARVDAVAEAAEFEPRFFVPDLDDNPAALLRLIPPVEDLGRAPLAVPRLHVEAA